MNGVVKYPTTSQTRRYTPCEIVMSEKQKQPEGYNVVYYISQGIVATGFRSGETSVYDFITNLRLSLI